MKKILKPADYLIITFVIITLVVLWIALRSGGDVATAEVYIDGDLYKSFDIGEKRQEILLKSKGGENTLLIENGNVSMIHASCPSQDCVKTGIHNTVGSTIACLPNRVLVRLTGEGDDMMDGVAY